MFEPILLAVSGNVEPIHRRRFDVVGHYARPDVFRLHVNEKPAPPVVAD